MNKHYLSILDVGCRYGVFPIFKKNIKILNYSGVDCDNSEIKRLKNKYSNEKNVKLHCAFLSNESKNIDLFIPDHRGYISSKKINKKSIWFNKLRKQESKINKIKNIKSQNSSEFIERNKIKTDIIKLDIEGGELDFLKGLNNIDFRNTFAFLTESELNPPYLAQSNQADLHNFFLANGYIAVKMNLFNEKLNIFHKNDLLPDTVSSIYLRKHFLDLKNLNDSEKIKFLNICYVLDLYGIFFEIFSKDPLIFRRNKSNIYNQRIKKMVGIHINELQKDVTMNKKYLYDLYKKAFSSDLPKLNKFNEDKFFND